MTERLGDERWIGVLRDHNAIFREKLGAFDGYEVKNQGDGFMLVFPEPGRAPALRDRGAAGLRGASRRTPRRADPGSHRPPHRRGDRRGGRLLRRNVILAARIAAQARGGEILVSEALHEQCGVDEGIAFGETRELELKGLAGTHTVYLAEWQRRGAAMSGV